MKPSPHPKRWKVGDKVLAVWKPYRDDVEPLPPEIVTIMASGYYMVKKNRGDCLVVSDSIFLPHPTHMEKEMKQKRWKVKDKHTCGNCLACKKEDKQWDKEHPGLPPTRSKPSSSKGEPGGGK